MNISIYNLDQFGILGRPSMEGEIWSRTTGYGGLGKGYEFMTHEQNCRLERVRVARMLFRGQHRRTFLWEGRSQFNFPPMLAQGRDCIPYVTFNVVRLISTTVTDLLLGAEPIIQTKARNGGLGGTLGGVLQGVAGTDFENLTDRCDLHRVFYDAATSASWAADAAAEAVIWKGDSYLRNIPAGEIYPIGPRNPDGQYSRYVRFATDIVRPPTTAGGPPKAILMETHYTPGEITRKCYWLTGSTRTGDATLSDWPTKNADGSDLAEAENTGLDSPSIIWLCNELDEGGGVSTSDYDGLIEFQDELNHKTTQIARVIAKHADPKLLLPLAQANSTYGGGVLSSHDVFFFRSKEELPQYLTWNAELAAAMEDRNQTLENMSIAGEVSPYLMGIRRGATPESAQKAKLDATKSLSRAARKGPYVRPFIRYGVDITLALQDASRIVRVGMTGIGARTSVDLRDGLPVDELAQLTALTTATAGKAVMSVERAVEIQITDPKARELEISRLAKAQADATPPMLFGTLHDEGVRGQGSGVSDATDEGVAA